MAAIDNLKIRTDEQIEADIAAGTQVAMRSKEELMAMAVALREGKNVDGTVCLSVMTLRSRSSRMETWFDTAIKIEAFGDSVKARQAVEYR